MKLFGSTLLEFKKAINGDQEELDCDHDFRAHIVCEDPRYPYLCINGTFNYGVDFNPKTGEIGNKRFCICSARNDFECICDL